MSDSVLICSDVCKNYRKHVALEKLSLRVKQGEIVALVGPNGAGKTTFIKCIVGLLRYNRGEILIDGVPPSHLTKKRVAYLPDEKFLYQWMTVKESIDYYRTAFPDFDVDKATAIITGFHLSMKQKVGACSKGMQEKLNMALTLSRKAKLYVFDEPLAAVDPLTRDDIIQLIKNNFSDSESSLLISTHLIRDVESLFTDVAFITDGKVILSEKVSELKKRNSGDLEDIYKEIMR